MSVDGISGFGGAGRPLSVPSADAARTARGPEAASAGRAAAPQSVPQSAPQSPTAAEPGARQSAASSTPVSATLRELADKPPIDAGRVATLRDAIARGAYALDADATAAAMIRQELAGR